MARRSAHSWSLDIMNMITLRSLVLLVAAAISLAATAQSAEILKGDAVTEAALIDALTPSPPPMLTRSIDRNPAAATPPKPAKAALLITFETNATVLTADAKRELDIVGRALNTNRLTNFNFVIEGHADPRGSPERNLRLSEGRAAAVKEYLVQNQSVSPERLQAIGKGDREPMNTANPAAPENRRVTFVNMSQ
jgi:OmpA-OmpF porin, OOP family